MPFKIIAFLLFLSVSASVFSQDKLYDLYKSREFEKCLKKCDAAIKKDPSSLEANWVRAICLWEMAQLPSKYKEIEPKPLEECLRSLGKIKQNDDEGFFESHADTLGYIKEFAEEMAREYSGTIKSKAVRIYKLMHKAYETDFNTVQVANIYLLAEDFDKCVEEIVKIYAYAPDTVDYNTTTASKIEALETGILFLVKQHMFNNAFQIIDEYRRKFADNKLVMKSFKNAMDTLLAITYATTDKSLYFEYAGKILYLFPKDFHFSSRIEKEIVALMNNASDTFNAIETPQSWRDTIPLREAFKYADIGNSLLKTSVFADKEKEISEKYYLHIPLSKRAEFKEICLRVANSFRAEATECRQELYQPADPLMWDNQLEYVSYLHAKDMFAYHYTDHVNRKGQGVRERVDLTDLKPIITNTFNGVIYKGATEVAENYIYGYPLHHAMSDEELEQLLIQIFSKWIERTEGQCENVMNGNYNYFGMSVFGDRWVAVFAKVVDIRD